MKTINMNLKSEVTDSIFGAFTALDTPDVMQHIQIVDEGIPHQYPSKLVDDSSAVYCFYYPESETFLKIGKVSRNSNARYVYQHYGFNARSTLAKSIIADKELNINDSLSEDNIKDWIFNNCQRIDIILDSSLDVFTLDLIEMLLHYKYKPKYEGFKSLRAKNTMELE